jgi:hypothetical protein
MESLQLGEYGVPIVFNQSLDISEATVYILYKKPVSGDTGSWNATKSDTSFYYMIQEGDIDEAGLWVLWTLAVWDSKRLWARASFLVRNAPISRIPA